MRQIKFRARRKDTNQWVYGYYFIGLNNEHYIKYVHKISDTTKQAKDAMVKPETVGQFTGLKDKNGVDIYEGDKVKMLPEFYEGDCLVKGFIGVVIYEDGCYGVSGEHKYEYMPLDEVCINNYKYEIIGNIHN